jgi:hypothetical protein
LSFAFAGKKADFGSGYNSSILNWFDIAATTFLVVVTLRWPSSGSAGQGAVERGKTRQVAIREEWHESYKSLFLVPFSALSTIHVIAHLTHRVPSNPRAPRILRPLALRLLHSLRATNTTGRRAFNSTAASSPPHHIASPPQPPRLPAVAYIKRPHHTKRGRERPVCSWRRRSRA